MPRLIADIGGTNARFALSGAAASKAVIEAERHLRVKDHPSLAAAIRAYLAALPAGTPSIEEAVLAVATPVDADIIHFTNNPWTFTREALKAELGLARLAIINDFVAQATAMPHLSPDDSVAIGGGQARPGWPIAVIGPGTGLGAAGLVPAADGFVVVASEAGHVSFAPHDRLELALLEHLIARHGHVSNERLISGPGLVALAEALARITDRSFTGRTPEAVTEAAARGQSAVAREALHLFSRLLGGAAGDLALTFGAKGGVYVCGGLCARLGDFFDHAGFRDRFAAKGRLSGFLADIACRLVTNPRAGLIGAAMHRFAP